MELRRALGAGTIQVTRLIRGLNRSAIGQRHNHGPQSMWLGKRKEVREMRGGPVLFRKHCKTIGNDLVLL